MEAEPCLQGDSRGYGERNPHQVARSEKCKNGSFSFRGTEGETCSPQERKNPPAYFYYISQYQRGLATGFHQKSDFHKTEFWENIRNRQAGHGKAKAKRKKAEPEGALPPDRICRSRYGKRNMKEKYFS